MPLDLFIIEVWPDRVDTGRFTAVARSKGANWAEVSVTAGDPGDAARQAVHKLINTIANGGFPNADD